MALSRKLTSLLLFFFFSIYLFSKQSQARNSQIFTKFSNKSSPSQNPNSDVPKTPQNTTEEEQDPVFVRETGNGYGLYGHELDQLPPDSNTGNNNNGQNPTRYTNTRLSATQCNKENAAYKPCAETGLTQTDDSFNHGKFRDSSSVSNSNNMNNDDEKQDIDRFYNYRSDAYGNREKGTKKRMYNTKDYNADGAPENAGKYFSGKRNGRDVNADSYGSGGGVEGYYWNRQKNIGEDFEP